MPPESLLLCLRTDSDLSHEVPAGRHHPGRHHPISMAPCAGVHEERRIWQQGPFFTFPSVLLGLQQLHRGPLEQPVGLPQHHTRPRRGGRRDAAWHPGRFIASSTTTQHGTKQHGAQPELSVQLVRCSHTAHLDASPSPPGHGIGSLVSGRTRLPLLLTGMRSSSKGPCNTTSASPSSPKTRSAPCAARFLTVSANTQGVC